MSRVISQAAACVALSALVSLVQCKTLTHNFNVGWVLANPDGAYNRPTIGINGQWPLPLITATVGDNIVVNLHNDLGNASTSLHFHGLFQNGTNHMDGAVGVTQCAVPPGHTFTYNFTVNQPGTYWYHAHNDGQYPEGLRGPLVIHDPAGPYEGRYDEELVLTFSDWYHRPIQSLIAEFINYKNPSGAEPIPQSALMNDTQNLQVRVEPGKTYLVRMVNVGAFAAQYVRFEGHRVQVVEVDGVWTEEAPTDVLYLAAAQRYSVLLTTKADVSTNFAIVGSMDTNLFDDMPDSLNPNVTGWLVYDENKPLPEPTLVDYDELHVLDDFELEPVTKEKPWENVDVSIKLAVKMANLGDGANYAFFNDITYVAPKVPSLYTALTVGGPANSTNPIVYGSHTGAHVLGHNQVVEIVINNEDDGDHPFHLHGHNFQVIKRSDEDAGPYDPENSSLKPEASDKADSGWIPMRRDTVLVRGNGHAVLRFRSDNPGVWLFHCHIEWHMDQGLVATLIAAPELLFSSFGGDDGSAPVGGVRASPPVPQSHLAACRLSDARPVAGNAAGNTVDVLNLAGENAPVGPLPAGFTTKGYVAMVCSCLAAFMGLASIYYYGNMPEDSTKLTTIE